MLEPIAITSHVLIAMFYTIDVQVRLLHASFGACCVSGVMNWSLVLYIFQRRLPSGASLVAVDVRARVEAAEALSGAELEQKDT